MDLASPLQPTILCTDDNWTGFRVVEPDVDASQIPLPESPVEDDHADDTDESTRHDDSGVLMQDSEFSSPNRTPPAETINLNQSDVDGGDGGIHSRSHSLTPVSMIQPTQVEVAVLLERLGELERELREAREEMEEREKELMQMRSVLEGLGLQVSVGRIGT